MTQFSLANLFGITVRESANDGSDFTNPDADYRRLFLGEDGQLHVKDSAGTVTSIGGATGAITTSGLTQATAKILGRTTASTGAIEEITVGSGLTFAAGSLSATGGSSDPITAAFGAATTAFEFNSSSLSGLTAMGSADVVDADTTIPGNLYIMDNDQTQVGQYATITVPGTMITKVSAAAVYTAYQYVGAWAGEATPGKFLWVGMIDNGTNILVSRTFANPGDSGPGAPTANYSTLNPGAFFPWYFAVRVASSTDVSLYASRDGTIWYAILLNYNNSMTVASAGVSVGAYGGGTFQVVRAAYDYIRYWNSALTFKAL